MSKHIITISDDNFEKEVLQSSKPVLVDFWAEWCGPCKVILPILEEVAEEYAGKMIVAKLNVDDHPLTPQKYGVQGIPTLMLFKNGNCEARHTGSMIKSQLSALIDSNT